MDVNVQTKLDVTLKATVSSSGDTEQETSRVRGFAPTMDTAYLSWIVANRTLKLYEYVLRVPLYASHCFHRMKYTSNLLGYFFSFLLDYCISEVEK